MQMMTRRFSLLMTGDLLGDTTPEHLAEYITGAVACGSTGTVVPGVPVWQNVAATQHDGGVTVTAELLGTDNVTGGDYRGDEVTEKHIAEYIMGAGEYLLGAGDVFCPASVTVTQV